MYLTQKNSSQFGFEGLLKIRNFVANKTNKISSETEVKKLTAQKAEGEFVKSSNSDFLNSIIHELKTPLNAIISFSEAIKLDIQDPQRIQECLEYANEINCAANDLNDLIHDLLEVNSHSSKNFTVDLNKEIDIRNLVKRSIKLNYDYALKRNILITSKIDEDVFTIKLDVKRMKQILTNLISNAIKYSPKKTEIKITVKNIFQNNQKFLQFIILDQGFGMTPNQLKTAFQKYQTIKNPNSEIVDSFGLGLPITKELVELQNGSIQAESQLNKGTKIILQFPYNTKLK